MSDIDTEARWDIDRLKQDLAEAVDRIAALEARVQELEFLERLRTAAEEPGLIRPV